MIQLQNDTTSIAGTNCSLSFPPQPYLILKIPVEYKNALSKFDHYNLVALDNALLKLSHPRFRYSAGVNFYLVIEKKYFHFADIYSKRYGTKVFFVNGVELFLSFAKPVNNCLISYESPVIVTHENLKKKELERLADIATPPELCVARGIMFPEVSNWNNLNPIFRACYAKAFVRPLLKEGMKVSLRQYPYEGIITEKVDKHWKMKKSGWTSDWDVSAKKIKWVETAEKNGIEWKTWRDSLIRINLSYIPQFV